MRPLRAPARIGSARRLPGRPRGVRRGGHLLESTGRLVQPGPLTNRWWKLAALVAGLLALVVLTLLAAFLPDQPEVKPPDIAAPAAHVPRPTAPQPSVSLGSPDIEPPAVSVPRPDVPSPSLSQPDGDGGGSQSAPTGPEHRTEFVHDHHRTYLWQFDLPLLMLAAVGLAALYPFARLPRQGQRTFGAAVATSLLVLAVALFAAGIDQRKVPNSYEREPAEIERSDGFLEPETITRHIHVHHHHPPIDLAVHWLLIGMGLASFAIRPARIAVEPSVKKPISQRVPGMDSTRPERSI